MKSITGLVLNDQLSQDEFRNVIQKLQEKTAQVLDLLDTTLLWTKTNFDSVTIKQEEIDLEKIVSTILSVYEHTCKNKQLTVTTHFDSAALSGDSEIISIVVRNMISNAIKFTPVGGEICIESRKVGTAYLITVSDSGAGIEMDLINQLLSPNYAFNHNSRSGHGHGIGLNLSHQLVKKINGKISIESQVGKGTKVTIHIPVTTS